MPVDSRPVVAVTRGVPGHVAIAGAQVRIAPDSPQLTRAELLQFVRGAAVAITMFHDRVDDEFLDAAGPQLRGVCNFAVGHDNIDLAACARRTTAGSGGVAVTNTPDAVTEGTANMTLGLLLACARLIVKGDAYARSGDWQRQGNGFPKGWCGMHLTGQTLLIVGPGRIGRAVALRALAFGMRVIYAARTQHIEFELAPIAARRVELDEGLALADVVSIHTPLSPQTRHLIDARRLALLRPHAIILNTARGPIIDEAALAEVLAARKIWGAGLDVFEHEPRVHPALVPLDNIVMCPHIGSAEQKYREIMTQMVCDNAAAILAGRVPPNLV